MAVRNLWRVIGSGAFFAAAMLAQSAARAAPVPATAKEAYDTFAALMQAHKCTEVLDLLAEPSVAPMLATIPVEYRLAVDAGVYDCARQNKQIELALKFAIAGTDLHDPRPFFWFDRLDMQLASGRFADLVATLELMATANPDALNTINLRWLNSAGRTILTAHVPGLQDRINAVIGAPGFHPSEPGERVDGYRYAAAVTALAAGHSEAAKAIYAQITEPETLLHTTLDPRLRALTPPDFDARAAVERDLDAGREMAAAHPDTLSATLALTHDYTLLDKGAEMLALLLPMRPDKAHPAVGIQTSYVHSWWSSVAAAYRMEGDYANAVGTLRQSMAPGEVDEKNTTEITEIAAMQLRFGRGADALTTLAPMTPPGALANDMLPGMRAAVRKLHGCAAWLDGKPALAEADLAYLRLHDADAPGARRTLALCMHRDDEAAASFIDDLAKPDRTVGILVQFSTYLPPPKTYPHYWYAAAIERLKTRPDIRAAIAKAGGTGKFNIPPLV